MKKNILIFALLASSFAIGQKKKTSTKPIVPPPVIQRVPEEKAPELVRTPSETEKCYVYKTETQKDSRVFVTENLFEYGWAHTNARLVITKYDYDFVKKKQAEKNGYVYAQSQTRKFIEGDFTIDNKILTFTPDKKEDEKRIFKLLYKPNSKSVDHLEDKDKNKYIIGDCLQPTVSL